MAALFPKIYDIIDQNPSKHLTLRCHPSISTEGSPELWDIFTIKPCNPPGPLSLYLLSAEPMYELGSLALRKQILTEQLLTLQERVDKELVGRRYPRKKIQDLLAGQVNAQHPAPSSLLEEVLCELFQVQKIHIDRRNKALSFSPPDLRLWTSTKPIVIAELDNSWSFTPTQSLDLGDWLERKELEGWKVSWPTADAKFEELKLFLQQKNKLPEGKVKKDDLALLWGKYTALEILKTICFQIN